MRTALDPADFAQGQMLLSRLPDTFSNILRTAKMHPEVEGRVSVSYEVAGAGRRQVAATSSNEAIRLVLAEIASLLTASAAPPETVQMNLIEIDSTLRQESSLPERVLSKARQQTLGASLPLSLKEHLDSVAAEEATSFAEVCRRFVLFGFEDIVAQSLHASPTSLFEMLGHELQEWDGSTSEQVMVRLDPGHAVRLRSIAKEYQKSISELTVLCTAHGVSLQRTLASLESKVSSCKGASIRNLVVKLGLQPTATPLVSSILAGNVKAPRKLLARLALAFDAPESLLSTLFRGSFDRRLVPAFKAEGVKPRLSTAPTTWTSAVKSLNLSAEDTKALLDLGV